jgi:L-ascorbate metabolism protein UlaG (beta-lactamase superfamily)
MSRIECCAGSDGTVKKRKDMPVEVQWFGHASFRLEGGGSVLYIDPWKLPSSPHDADAVFVSHSHYDHCSPPDVAKVSKEGTVIVAPADTIQKLSATNAITPGESVAIQDIAIEAVAAYNIGKTFHPRGHNWCGAVITLGGRRVYYAGDTDLVPQMSDLKDVDLALLPVGGTYTMSADEAAAATRSIGCKEAVPYHWGDVIGSRRDAQAFAKAAACPVRILKRGDRFTI